MLAAARPARPGRHDSPARLRLAGPARSCKLAHDHPCVDLTAAVEPHALHLNGAPAHGAESKPRVPPNSRVHPFLRTTLQCSTSGRTATVKDSPDGTQKHCGPPSGDAVRRTGARSSANEQIRLLHASRTVRVAIDPDLRTSIRRRGCRWRREPGRRSCCTQPSSAASLLSPTSPRRKGDTRSGIGLVRSSRVVPTRRRELSCARSRYSLSPCPASARAWMCRSACETHILW